MKYAATRNYPELCDLLLEHPNIDVNMKEVRTYNGTYYGLSNSSGSWNLVHTPLILAVQYGHSEIVKRLVKAPGIDLNFQEPNGEESAAMIAASRERYWIMLDDWGEWVENVEINLEIVKILSETEGVDWNLEDIAGDTAFTRALFLEDVKCLKVLRKVPSIDWNYIDTSTASFSTLVWTLTDAGLPFIKHLKAARFLLSLPDVLVDIEELRNEELIGEAVKQCKLYVRKKIKNLQKTVKKKKPNVSKKMKVEKLYATKKMKKFFEKKIEKKKQLETDLNRKDNHRKLESIFDFLLIALQKDLNQNIVDVFVAALEPLDIVELVIYKVSNDDQRK